MTRKASPQHARAAAMAIVHTLRDRAHTAYFAGGCVRDELLGLKPTDYDVATDAVPDRIRAVFKRTTEVGAAFGVILVTLGREEGLQEQATVEVATFRSEGPYTDKRRPDSVSFSDPKSDALRRDFTINALFLDPVENEIIDYVGGQEDLRRRLIRAVGDPEARLAEDHLRALRAVRFAARLDFQIDPATAAAVTRHARELAGVSRERIGDEVRRMMAHPSRARAAALLAELGLDHPVLNEPSSAGRSYDFLAQPVEDHDDPDSRYTRHLAAWALDRGLTLERGAVDQLVRHWRAALCLSNDEKSGLGGILRNLLLLRVDWATMGTAAQRRAIAAGGVRLLHALDLFDHLSPTQTPLIRARIAELAATPSGICPDPILTGDHLVEMGHPPGPRIKKILDQVYNAQLEDRVTTLDQARELAHSLRV